MRTKLFSFSRQFKRALELPSENWLELAQDWCCHGNSHPTSVAGVFEPGEKDCFVGEYYIKGARSRNFRHFQGISARIK